MTPDLGCAHVIDWRLWRALHTPNQWADESIILQWAYSSPWPSTPAEFFPPDDWTRYDGELL
jgi:hypothetical protein